MRLSVHWAVVIITCLDDDHDDDVDDDDIDDDDETIPVSCTWPLKKIVSEPPAAPQHTMLVSAGDDVDNRAPDNSK